MAHGSALASRVPSGRPSDPAALRLPTGGDRQHGRDLGIVDRVVVLQSKGLIPSKTPPETGLRQRTPPTPALQ